jgi:hypothetical protein
MNSPSAVPDVIMDCGRHIVYATREVLFCCAGGQSGCGNNQPETQEHVDFITMTAIVLLKTNENEIP